jgi:hypothetical protein
VDIGTRRTNIHYVPCSEIGCVGEVLFDEVAKARGGNAQLDTFADDLARRLKDPSGLEPIARRVVEMMALVPQGSLLVRHSSSAVARMPSAARGSTETGGMRSAHCRVASTQK